MMNKAILSWSGGKDSALALYELIRLGSTEIATLLTTVTQGYDRISMHGVRRELLVKQALALGYPLEEVTIPQHCTNEAYEQLMQQTMEKFSQAGITHVVFGDLFLEDVRVYREERLGRVGMQAIFPLWGRNTGEAARQFIQSGFRAIVVCVDTQMLGAAFAGREYDNGFLRDLPEQVDPCGENGEFHTFVYDGPVFRKPIQVERAEKVLRENRFYYCDLVSASTEAGGSLRSNQSR